MSVPNDLKRLHRYFFPKVIVRRGVKRKKVTQATAKKLAQHKEAARALVHARLEHFNAHYGLTYHRVAIRAQRSRWGSCSKKGNLNFNFALLFLPQELSDAVIVHELCHLKEFNHGRAFWKLMSETIPDYADRKSKLARTHPDKMVTA